MAQEVIRQALSLVTPASAPLYEPQDLAQVMRISNKEELLILEGYIASAVNWVEIATGRALLTQTWDLSFDDRFPYQRHEHFFCRHEILIPKPPLQSVTWVKYVDVYGDTQTLTAGTDYEVNQHRSPGVVRSISGWPITDRVYRAVQIRFVCGYGASSTNIEPAILQAIRLLVADAYENRQSVAMISGGPLIAPAVSKAVDALLTPYKVWVV